MTRANLTVVKKLIESAPVERPANESPYPCTHFGNRDRFLDTYAADVRHDASCGWRVFDGARWALDTVGQVQQMAQAIMPMIRDEVRVESNAARQKQLLRWLDKAESMSGITQMLELARTDPRIARTPEAWDPNPDVVNAANGIIDLRTGRLRPHDRAEHHTKLIPIAYDPDASCVLWEAFLARIVPDPLVRTLLRVAVGYSLTGHTSEQVLMLLLGIGRNGKSVFINMVRQVAGEYAISADFETFVVRGNSGGGARGDLARMHGARVITTAEAGESQRLNESLVKLMTGGDTITARYLYGREFEYTLQAMIWMVANHRPVIKGGDDGIWRRFLLVPFNVQIPADEVDKALPEKLKTELPGILAWAVSGAMQWYREGLIVPTVVRNATDAYREESDTLAEFLSECCDMRPGVRARAADLYLAYKQWSETRGEREMTANAFGRKLTDRGIAGEKVGGDRFRFGMTIRPDVLLRLERVRDRVQERDW